MIHHSAKLLLALAAWLALWACAAPERPHLFLITSDTLRVDHLSLNGYPRHTSPNLDALAAQARNFTQAITLIPKTGPSMASHFSGLPPNRHGVQANPNGIPQEVPLLAEMLRDHGYDTLAFVSNPILAPRKGFDRGFTRYEQFAKVGGLPDLVASFVRMASEHDWNRPTFVWIHLIDPHGPYTPPADLRDLFAADELFRADTRVVPIEYEPTEGAPRNRVLGAVPIYQRIGEEARAAWYVSQYDAEIRYMDAAVGRILGELREQDIYQRAGILFTADHGESLGEHNYFFEHGWFTYDASVRVPLILKPPGGAQPSRHDEQVSNLDTLPTLLALAQLHAPLGLAGRNLLDTPLRKDEATPLLVQNPSSYRPRYFAVRTPSHKFIVEEGTGSEELYDLASDPAETRNIAGADTVLAQRLRAELERLRSAGPGALKTAPVAEPGGEEREQLKALGYVDP